MDGELDRPAGVAARRQAGLTTSALAASLEDLQVTCQPPVLSHQPSLTSPQCLRREVDSEYEQRYRSLPFNQTVEVEAASSSFAFDDEELDGPVYRSISFPFPHDARGNGAGLYSDDDDAFSHSQYGSRSGAPLYAAAPHAMKFAVMPPHREEAHQRVEESASESPLLSRSSFALPTKKTDDGTDDCEYAQDSGCYRSMQMMEERSAMHLMSAAGPAVQKGDTVEQVTPFVLDFLATGGADVFDAVLALLPAHPGARNTCMPNGPLFCAVRWDATRSTRSPVQASAPFSLANLPSCACSFATGLFCVMRVCKAWREAARAHYLLQRVVRVHSKPDELLRAYRLARAGDTLCLQAGVHHLSSELTLDRPVRLLSEAEAEVVLSPWRPGEQHSSLSPSATPPPPEHLASAAGDDDQTDGREAVSELGESGVEADEGGARRGRTYADALTSGEESCGVVLASSQYVLMRTRCAAQVAGLTLCRMGDAVGYPNAVAYAEAGHLRMHRCRVTCGGGATSVTLALQAFAGAPEPGQSWSHERSPHAPVHEHVGQSPQSGVWVGAAACVELRGCTIANCMGPGVKIYRGRLLAQRNTIACSSRGANVVANGGHIVLEDNEIHGATGDGISSWNNSVMSIARNSIHGNSGAGIAVNTGGGSVSISHNAVFDNACQPVIFATSSKQATLTANDFHGGRVVGCDHPTASPPTEATPAAAQADHSAPQPPRPCLSRQPSSQTMTAFSTSSSALSAVSTLSLGASTSVSSPASPSGSSLPSCD